MSKQNTPTRFWLRVQRGVPDECWPWTAYRTKRGYGRVMWHGSVHGAHRVAFMLEYGRWPAMNACHSCDNRICCNPSHLFEGTQAENTKDMALKGRGAQKLSADQVRMIRSIAGVTQVEIARQFSVSRALISLIRAGKCRQYVE